MLLGQLGPGMVKSGDGIGLEDFQRLQLCFRSLYLDGILCEADI